MVCSPSRVHRMLIYDDGFFHKDDPSVRYRSYVIAKDPKTNSPKPSQQRTITDKVTIVTITIWDRLADFFRRVADAFMRLIGSR